MAEIKFSPEAINDLQQTKEYIIEELCNEQAAVNTVSKITKRIRMLADFPESGAPLSSVIDIETDYRFLVKYAMQEGINQKWLVLFVCLNLRRKFIWK